MYKQGTVALLIVAYITGCNPNTGTDISIASQVESDARSQFTLFTENFEFFVEQAPLTAGMESVFLVHVTSLASYKPVEPGRVTIAIDGVSATSDHPHQPGIYEVPFIPKNAGEFQASFTFQSGKLTATVEQSLDVYQDPEDLHSQDESDAGHVHVEETEGEITYLKEKAWNSDFMVTEARLQSFYSVIPTSGEILAMPGEKKNVAANGRGMVRFASRNLVQGSPVTRGELLFTISSATMLDDNFELRYREWQNSYEKSRSEYERHKKLNAQGAISEREFMNTQSVYVADSLRFYNLQANATEDGLKVNSPVTGTIHELNVSEGQFIDIGQIMVIISSNRTLLLRADLSQQFYDQLTSIGTANFRPAYSDQVFSIEEMDGRLLATGSSVAENDHYLPVMFEVMNDGRLLEGAYAEVYLKAARKDNCLVLPGTALMEEQGYYYVYVQVTGESYSKRVVVPGNSDGKYVEITQGLSPGERVVTRGVMLLKAASMVTGTVGHGHEH